MALLFSNNASAELAAALTADATTLYVEEGKGSYFPVISRVGDYFYVTLVGDSVMEIVKVTATEGDTFTIVRAQDNTEAAAFAIGDLIELRITAADFKDILTSPKLSDFFADSSKVNPIYSTDADTYQYWSGMRGGVYYYNRAGSLVNQPSQYGLLLHCAQLAFVFQLWKSLPNGDLYYRSMSDTNERDEWTKLAKDADLTALAEQIDETFLKKSGGTMTGPLYLQYILRGVTNSRLGFYGGDEWRSGAYVELNGPQADYPNVLSMCGADGSLLQGQSDGWKIDDNNILTSAGGTVTGELSLGVSDNKQVYLDDTTYGYKYMLLQAGEWDSGALIQLMRHDSPNDAGVLVLRGGTCDLRLKPDGTLSWNGSQAFLPAGAVFAFAANSAPAGCLLCNGAAVSRTTYAALFAAIGTTYGTGDGSTTFNLPNLTDKFIQGSGTAGTSKSAGLPNITGNFAATWRGAAAPSYITDGKLYTHSTFNASLSHGGADSYGAYYTFNASRANSLYGKSTTVQPPALTMRYYIKY